MASRQLLAIARRNMSAFHPRQGKSLPVGTDVVYLSPSRVRPAHWTEAELAALPAPVAKPNLDKGKYLSAAPLAFPLVFGWGFMVFNNFTGVYNNRMDHLRPY